MGEVQTMILVLTEGYSQYWLLFS